MHQFNYNVNSFWSGPSCRFKGGGGGGGSAPSPQIAETEDARWAKEKVYPLVTNAIGGGGFGTPTFNILQRRRARGGLQESFDQTKRDMDSQLARTIRPEDSRVRNFVGSTLDRAYATSQDQMERGFRASDVSDKDVGMDMAGTMLANEQRINIGGAQAFNNALATNMQMTSKMGTFGTNIAAGVGQGMMDYNYAQKMGDQ